MSDSIILSLFKETFKCLKCGKELNIERYKKNKNTKFGFTVNKDICECEKKIL